ncbi:MAG: hypothetical protein ETSY1_03835 [Candidatus Entotheonella factor]|uniref:ABC transporter permease n=1 Tax=Entotheonella factor TaxID=1429438 RepID=W4LXA2_ENTF1|nr:MAG: hypothetical protein ETSY1_03835 [Candidatus Entotheonella factor]
MTTFLSGYVNALRQSHWTDILLPLYAVGTALLLGACLIWASGASVADAYLGLFEGMLGSRRALVETCIAAIPYILAGLSVALGFHAGLFNIGAEGQFYIGALGAAGAGYMVVGLPGWMHLPLALVAGILGGAIWGGDPRFSQSALWRPRSHQHHYDELHRGQNRGLFGQTSLSRPRRHH